MIVISDVYSISVKNRLNIKYQYIGVDKAKVIMVDNKWTALFVLLLINSCFDAESLLNKIAMNRNFK